MIENATTKNEKLLPSFSALFELAFRPFFLFGAVFSIVSLVIWAGLLTNTWTVDLYGGHIWWHMHEMLFGFVSAIIVGFLLTAVQNWTGIASLSGKKLMMLFFLWSIARIGMIFPNLMPTTVLVFLDILFIPLSALALAIPIVKIKLWRNLIFIPILVIMSLLNVFMHSAVLTHNFQNIPIITTVMVMLITLIMTVMGGRVFPMFTANGTKTARVNAIPKLEIAVVVSTLMTVLLSFDLFLVAPEIKGSVFIVAAIFHAVRVFRWKFSVTLHTPLVWSLHISYWAIPIGLGLIGIAYFSQFVTHSQGIHALTVGAMGTMILSMIARVSLGHTGRVIKVGWAMSIAFYAIILAFIVRVFGVNVLENYQVVIIGSVVCWTIGYGLFVKHYWRILFSPRAS